MSPRQAARQSGSWAVGHYDPWVRRIVGSAWPATRSDYGSTRRRRVEAIWSPRRSRATRDAPAHPHPSLMTARSYSARERRRTFARRTRSRSRAPPRRGAASQHRDSDRPPSGRRGRSAVRAATSSPAGRQRTAAPARQRCAARDGRTPGARLPERHRRRAWSPRGRPRRKLPALTARQLHHRTNPHHRRRPHRRRMTAPAAVVTLRRPRDRSHRGAHVAPPPLREQARPWAKKPVRIERFRTIRVRRTLASPSAQTHLERGASLHRRTDKSAPAQRRFRGSAGHPVTT